MRRALMFIVPAAVLAAPVASAQDSPPKLSATLAACETGAEPAQRFAVFTGSMPARSGTRRMSIRFDLEERGSAQGVVERVTAPKLGRWNRSKAGVAGFVYTKRVTGLTPGRWYRAVVSFRWHDEKGRVQRTAKRVTPFCHQPDQRANLELDSLRSPRPGTYRLTIVNTGKTAAPESWVVVEPPSGTPVERPVSPLAPGEQTHVDVEAARCAPGSPVMVRLDARKAVDESREDDNMLESECPAADRVR